MCIGRLAGKTSHQPEQLNGLVSVYRGVKSRAEYGEDERVEIQMSLELEFAAMRVNLRNLTGDILMDMLALRMSYSLLRSRYSTEVRTMNILGKVFAAARKRNPNPK